MGPFVVVLVPPSSDDVLSLLETSKPMLREALSSYRGVERLGEGAVDGLARPREDQLHASATPIFRQISSTGVPASPCRSAIVICSSANRLFLIDPSSRLPAEPQNEPKSTPFTRASPDQDSG